MYHDIISKPHFMSTLESGFLTDLVEKGKGFSKVLALVGMVSTAVSVQAENPQWKSTDCPDSMAVDGLSCVSTELKKSGALKRITMSGKFVIGGLPVPVEYLRNPDVKSAALKYKAHLDAIDLQVKGEQSCDDTDSDYDALWDDCNALHVAILNAREKALDNEFEATQARVADKKDAFEASEESVVTRKKNIEKQSKTIAEQQALLGDLSAYQAQR